MLHQGPHRIVFTAYSGISLLDLGGPLEVFNVARAFSEHDRGAAYESVIVSVKGGPTMTADGVELVTRSVHSIKNQAIDTLIVPGAFLDDGALFFVAPVGQLEQQIGVTIGVGQVADLGPTTAHLRYLKVLIRAAPQSTPRKYPTKR